MEPTVGPETVQWIKVLVAKPADLRLTLRTIEESWLPHIILLCYTAYVLPPIPLRKNEKLKKIETHSEERHHHAPEYLGVAAECSKT